jgi:general secretion pathway protein M
MNLSAAIERYLARIPYAAAIGYFAVLLVLGFVTWGAISGILDWQQAVATSADILSRLDGRVPSRSNQGGDSDRSASAASPFLEGSTVTIAGAALLQRVGGTVTRYGGSLLSSQVDLQGSQAKPGFVSVVVSCELEQSALQQLLYDLESGLPFIFVDQLVVQAPTVAASAPGGKMRVLLAVSGQWEGAK